MTLFGVHVGVGEIIGILVASTAIAGVAWYYNFGVGEGRHRDKRDK
jgi:hypothetical protein